MAGLAGGCALPTGDPYGAVPVGSRVVLHRDLPVAAGDARVRLQGGEVVPAVDQYRPHCQFRTRRLSEGDLVIRADRFTVERVSRAREEVVRGGAGDRRVAALLFGGDYVPVMAVRNFYLASPRQPDVYLLLCAGVLEHAYYARPPTLAEIDAALGAYASLHPAGAADAS